MLSVFGKFSVRLQSNVKLFFARNCKSPFRQRPSVAPIAMIGCFVLLMTPLAEATIYISDDGSANAIRTYAHSASGDVAPNTSIAGASTWINQPRGLAVDANWVYLVDQGDDSIKVFPKGADGNMSPSRIIRGGNTGLTPHGIAVDANWIYVANAGFRNILVFPIGANGDVAPTRTIEGGGTTLVNPFDIAVDSNWMYVANGNRDSVAVFPLNGNGNIAPARFIEGSATGFGRLISIAIDANWIYVAGEGITGIFVFPLNGSGNIAPTRFIRGVATLLTNGTYGLAVDAGWIYATDYGTGIHVFPLTGDGNIVPTRTIVGTNTLMMSVMGLTLDSTGSVTLPAISIMATAHGAEPATNGSYTVTSSVAAGVGGLTVNYTVDGASTAAAGADYATLSGSVVILEGETTATISVAVIDDSEVEAVETVIVNLTGDTAYALGSPSVATVDIISEDVGPPTTHTVGGTVSGLTGSVTLQNNSGDDIIKTTNDGFTFPAQTAGTDYSVLVSSQPTGQTCTVTNGSGTNISANITDVIVACTDDVVPPPPPATPVPTLSEWALITLAMLLAGIVFIRRKQLS